MAPSFPAEISEIDQMPSKPTTTTSNENNYPQSNGSQSTFFSSIQENIEDIRETIVETEFYINNQQRFQTVSNVASSFYQYSKKIAWVLGTTSLVLVIPLLYEIDKELGPGYEPPSNSTQTSTVDVTNNADPATTTTTTTTATTATQTSTT